MSASQYSLAIETSARQGGVTLGRGDELVESLPLGQKRHAVELMPAIDELARRHGFTPKQIARVYVSVGPGSFTGLRIGITTAKTLAHTTGAKLVAVPTLDVVVENAPADRPHVAVCLAAKRGQCYTGVYSRNGDGWQRELDPMLLSPAELVERAERPLAVIGDHLPDFDWPNDVECLGASLAMPSSAVVWRLGQKLAEAGTFTEPLALTPHYVRLPEAEEVWRAKQT